MQLRVCWQHKSEVRGGEQEPVREAVTGSRQAWAVWVGSREQAACVVRAGLQQSLQLTTAVAMKAIAERPVHAARLLTPPPTQHAARALTPAACGQRPHPCCMRHMCDRLSGARQHVWRCELLALSQHSSTAHEHLHMGVL